MNWSDYEAIWKRQPPPVGASADIAALHATFETKRRKLAATLLVRDSLEGFGGFVFALVFAGVAWRIGSRGWPIFVGAAIILGISLVFLRDWWRRRQTRPGPATPLLVRIDDELAELRHQRRLLANIGLWYFLPYIAAITLIGSTLGRVNHGTAPPGFLLTLLTTPATAAWIIVFVGVSAAAIFWAWRANRDAVKNQIDPRIQELEKFRRDVQPSSTAGL